MDSSNEIAPDVPSFRRPADYYSSLVDPKKSIFPRWVPFGCGSASIVLIVVLLIGAAGVSSGAFSELFEMLFASIQGEVDKMLATDVKPPQKAAFDNEMKTLRDHIRTGSATMDRLQPLMKSIREVSTDERVTSAELEKLTREVRTLNTGLRKGS